MFRMWKPQLLRYLTPLIAENMSGVDAAVTASALGDTRASLDYPQALIAEKNITKLTDKGRSTKPQSRLADAKVISPTDYFVVNREGRYPIHYVKVTPSSAGLCHPLSTALKRMQIHELTPLQGALVPLFLKGKHTIAHAETGSGKSFGVALGTINRVLRDNIPYRLHTLILVPTEELALQYDKWLKHFGGCAHQIVQTAIEGVPLESQLSRLHNVQPHVLVGTPQRVADIMINSELLLGEKLRKKVDTIVMDEADVLMQMPVKGMLPGAEMTTWDLVDRLYRSHRHEVPAQIVAISATLDGTTTRKLNTWMKNDQTVRIISSYIDHALPPSLNFYFFGAARQNAVDLLLKKVLKLIYLQHRDPRILLFVSDDAEAERAVALLSGWFGEVGPLAAVAPLGEAPPTIDEAGNSNISSSCSIGQHQQQHQRQPSWLVRVDVEEKDLPNTNSSGRSTSSRGSGGGGKTTSSPPVCPDRATFPARLLKSAEKDVFLCNDSAVYKLVTGQAEIGVMKYDVARGLHIRGITHVVLFGEAPSALGFVHCAGRTGRMGYTGEVLSVFPSSSGKAYQGICQGLNIPFRTQRSYTLDSVIREEEAKRESGIETRTLSLSDTSSDFADAMSSSSSSSDTAAAEGFFADDSARALQFNTNYDESRGYLNAEIHGRIHPDETPVEPPLWLRHHASLRQSQQQEGPPQDHQGGASAAGDQCRCGCGGQSPS